MGLLSSARHMTSEPCIVVGSYTSLSEMPTIASELARAGLLRAYVTPFGSTKPGIPSGFNYLLPVPVRRRLALELTKRTLPRAIPGDRIVHKGAILEALAVMSGRVPLLRPTNMSLQLARNVVFD